MWAIISAALAAIGKFFDWRTSANNTEAAVNKEKLDNAQDANKQVTTGVEARQRARDDAAAHPERVRDADGDARPFDPNASG